MVKKLVYMLLCTIFILSLSTGIALGTNNVSDINVEVAIHEDGSAYITQTWNCHFTEGTECYIPIENLDELSISDFLVSDGNGAYTYEESWDINASFEDKAGKYGMVKTDTGYELCWGISEYGERRYAIEYKVNQLVGGYEDYDGFNFQFINSGMGTLPTDVTLHIVMQDGTTLSADNCAIWAFGFDGQINFEEGQVISYTESPLSGDTDSVIIMMQLNKDLITPVRVVKDSFETVKEEAFIGSDYDNKALMDDTASSAEEEYEEEIEPASPLVTFLGLLFSIGPAAMIIYLFWHRGKKNRKAASLYKNADYFREAPIAGNLEATFVLAKQFKQADNDGNLVGAAFLELINAGCLEPMTEKKVGLFGKEKESVSLKLIHPPDFSGATSNMLFDLLILVSGKDQILQEQELENYCTRNYSAMIRIIDAAKQDGQSTLSEIECFDSSKKAKPLGLSERGVKLLTNIMGFKKFLLEFSLIGERSISESVIWQDYLTFATLLGIADKVMDQFEKVYPNKSQYSVNAHYYYMLSHRYTKASYNAAQAARSAGSGGISSLGGGGGFSGGGSGGGTR